MLGFNVYDLFYINFFLNITLFKGQFPLFQINISYIFKLVLWYFKLNIIYYMSNLIYINVTHSITYHEK